MVLQRCQKDASFCSGTQVKNIPIHPSLVEGTKKGKRRGENRKAALEAVKKQNELKSQVAGAKAKAASARINTRLVSGKPGSVTEPRHGPAGGALVGALAATAMSSAQL